MALDKETKRLAKQKVRELRKNPPKVTDAHRRQAEVLFDQNKAFEDQKDKDIARERKAFAKDLSSFAYNHICGVGKLFNGIGEGKKACCSHPNCGEHKGTMHYFNGEWWCPEHRSFGQLPKIEQERETYHGIEK